MPQVSFEYRAKRKTRVRLLDAGEYVVVRTRRRGPLSRTPLSALAHDSVKDWTPVVRFDDAGVEVLRAPGGSRSKARRDAVRAALKKEEEVQFAGRVLATRGTRRPVIYTENLFIKFRDDTGKRTCRRLLKENKLTPTRELTYARNAWFVAGQEGCGRGVFELAAALLEHEAVELCHPELVRAVRERGASPQQWHLQSARIGGIAVNEHAHVVEAWQLSEGQGVTVAVIDDGVDVDHDEFRGADKIVAPRDATRRRDDARPQFASERHGTACAGVACANGSHGASGVAPKSRLMPIRLRSALGSQNEADAIVWAADHGADVISCSWGPEDGDFRNPDDPLHDQRFPLPDSTRLALEHATNHGRNGRGCVITWAAGNGNESADNDGYASCDRVIAVGACDDRGKKAPYSDFGDAVWCVFPSNHFFASVTPGIWTTDRRGGAGYNPGRSLLGDAEGHYTNGFGGTSSACPGAAGVAALVLARNPELRWEQVRDILRESCEKIDRANAGYDADGHSPLYGHGRLNARLAVELALPQAKRYTALHRAVREVAIVDNKTTKLRVEVGDSAAIHDVRIGVDIEHTYRGDLIVRLLPPPVLELAPITLHDRGGGSQPNLKRIFDVAAVPALAALKGLVPTGTWMLEVRDTATQDEGRIVHFQVELDL